MKVPFIGRENELNSCAKLLKNKIPKCRVITIEGVPGIGKTAFLHKVQEIAENEKYEIYSGIINEGHEALSLQIWMQILEKCRLKIMQQNKDYENKSPKDENLFAALYGSWDNITSFQEIGTENKKHLLFSWIGSFLAKFTNGRNICISIDNAHLCSKSSINLLSYLLSILSDYPIVFIISFRPVELSNNRDLQDLTNELQFYPYWERVYLDSLDEETLRIEYKQLKQFQTDLPDESTLYNLTKGNPLRLSAFMQLSPGTNLNQKPLLLLWNQYKKRISSPVRIFTEYLSLLGNYFTETEAGIICRYLGDSDYHKILNECIYASMIIKQDEGFSFFHDDFRKIIEEQIPSEEKQKQLNQIICLFEKQEFLEKDKNTLRLAGLYKNTVKGVPVEKRILCYLQAADIMEKWNAWDEAAKYLEEVQTISKSTEDINLQDEAECRLARCYVENLDLNWSHLLLSPLVERLLEKNDTEKLYQLLQLYPFMWNLTFAIYTKIIDRLLEETPQEDDKRNNLLLIQAGLHLGDVSIITEEKKRISGMRESILKAENENDKYHFYLLMGAYNSILKNFDKANEYLHMAELLPVSRFRLEHLIGQIEIALFTASTEYKDAVLENIQNILKVTQNRNIKNTYEGMLQRRYLYNGDWKNVLTFGDNDDHNRIDNFTLPRFITHIWTGNVNTVKNMNNYHVILAGQVQKKIKTKDHLVNLVWFLSLYSLLYDKNGDIDTIQSGIESLLSEKNVHCQLRQIALVPAARICRWVYTTEKCRDFYNELVSYDPYFLEAEIHSIEIAKALLSERLEDIKAQEAHYIAALNWCEEVNEWPWRCWIYAQLGIFYSKTDPQLSNQNRNQALEIARRLNINHVLTILGEEPLPSIDTIKENPKENNKLSPRETEVLKLLSKGYTDKEIGKYLFISEHTVANHLRKIYRKIDASNRVEASRIAILEGIIDEP
jgi:DNA-binding CsgD family transcriptional regulator